MQKNMDGHGRIYISKELRRRHGLGRKTAVRVLEVPDGILVAPLSGNRKEDENGEKQREKK